MAAPPAGGWLAAMAAKVTLSVLLRLRAFCAPHVRGVQHERGHDQEERPAEERDVDQEMPGVSDPRHARDLEYPARRRSTQPGVAGETPVLQPGADELHVALEPRGHRRV